MKILHVINSLDPKQGGPAEGVKQLSNACRLIGQEPEIVSLDSPEDAYIKGLSPVHALGPGKLNYSYSAKLVPWLKKNAGNYDVVVVHGIWQYHSFAAWRALHGTDTPYVIYTHGMLSPWFKRTYPLKHLKKWLYWPWGVYPVLRDANATLFTCEEERNQARKSFWLYKCNEVVALYGTGGSKGDPQAELADFYSQFPELRSKRLLLFMGRLHPIKGCDLLIKAFAKTFSQSPEWHLVIAGPDQVGWKSVLSSMAERLGVSSQITWAGMIRGATKWGALRAADAFVLPSHHENFGVVVAEALSCGTPVLISNQVNIWREIEASGAALVANDDVEGMAQLLSSWKAATDEQRQMMKLKAHECFQKNLEIRQVAERFIDIVARVAGIER